MPKDDRTITQPPADAQKISRRKQGAPIEPVSVVPGPITREQVREAFNKANAKVKRLPPSDEEVSRLAGIFTHWKILYYGYQQKRGEHEAAANDASEARQAVETLRRVLPRLIARHDAEGDPFAKWQVKHLQALQDALHNALHDIATPQMPYPNDWRWLLTDEVLLKEITPNFPGAGISNEGPIARFLAEIIPHITGQKIEAATIAQQIIVSRRK